MKRLYRSTSDRMLSGVLGGLAEYFNIDATIIRLAFVVLVISSSIHLFSSLFSGSHHHS